MYAQSVKNKQTNKKTPNPIYFNTSYRTEIKLVPIIMDYCQLQFDAVKFFLGVRQLEESLSNFNFFNITPQNFQQYRKGNISNFHKNSNISLRFIRRWNYS